MNKNTKIIIGILAIFLAFSIIGNIKSTIDKENIKQMLLEAKKPSKIEKQQQEIERLRKVWERAEQSCKDKPNIEKSIQDLSYEMTGVKKYEG